MQFNYNNPKIHIWCAPHCAAGQFLGNCLSYSKHLIFPSSDDILSIMTSNPNDYLFKHKTMMDNFGDPDKSKFWHQYFYASSRWYTPCSWALDSMDIEDHTTGYFHVGFKDTESAQYYMDNYWRKAAIAVSQTDTGFFLGCHQDTEAEAWKMMFPKAKIFTVTNYDYFRNLTFKAKTQFSDAVESWWTANEVYHPQGFIFDLDALVKNEQSFIKQMSDAYQYFDLDDFNVIVKDLQQYRMTYLKFNYEWLANKRN
jgi:hypothetical protein